MKNIDLGQAVTVLANIGVIAGIVFLAIEIQQNSELLEMDRELAQREQVLGRFIESEDLPTIASKISEVTGSSATETRLVANFGLTLEEAKKWRTYVLDQFLSNSINWEISGDSQVCGIGARLAANYDNHILLSELANSSLSAEYVECVTEELRRFVCVGDRQELSRLLGGPAYSESFDQYVDSLSREC